MPDIGQILIWAGPWAVFFLILVESFGVPVPGETALISAALLASQGQLSIVVLLIVAWVAAVVGDNIGYTIGRLGGRRLVVRHGRRIGITDAKLARFELFFARRGSAIVVVARFFAGLRQLNGIIAGIMRMPPWKFLLYNSIGAGLWVGSWGLSVYYFGQHFLDTLKRLGPLGLYVVIAIAVAALAAWLIWRLWLRRPPR